MLVVHLADIHIGKGRNLWRDTRTDEPRYLVRHRKMLQEILDKLKQLNSELMIILAGDTLDCGHPTVPESELLAWWLFELSQLGELHIIPGNHELLYNHVTALGPVKAYTQHTKLNWHVECETTETPIGRFLWVPYSYTSRLLEPANADYVVAHYAAKGCIYSNGSQAAKGWEIKYDQPVKQWFLGDIHARQKVADNAWYVGSPCQLDFGESGAKGFHVYDPSTGTVKQIPLIAADPLLEVAVRDTMPEFLENAIYKVYVSEKFSGAKFPDNVVRIAPLAAKLNHVAVSNETVSAQIDFGDPLDGLEDVLSRCGVVAELHPEARSIAADWIQ